MMSETEIATETLRYSADIPAQALAYKIGSLRMMALCKRAQERLRFAIRHPPVSRMDPGERVDALAGARATCRGEM